MKTVFLVLLAFGLSLSSNLASAATYIVTNTLDSGPNSLRQALIDANNNPGADIIEFQIATAGNTFEGVGANRYAVIEVLTALPIISEALVINGFSQTNTNDGAIASLRVGVDNISLGTISYPDVYVVPSPSYVFPSNATGTSGNGLTINAPNVTIQGLAISGFGNTSTNGGNASGHSDISMLRSPSARIANITISGCFISSDPLGVFPTVNHRRTKGNGILILGNNDRGVISNNYIAHSGTYGIHFNGNTDNLSVGPSSTTVGSRNWTISGNRLVNISTNPAIVAITRVSDGISLMKCVSFRILNNHITDVEQIGVDLGYNSDSNYIANNTITGLVKTSAVAPQGGMRISLCSERDTLTKNIIFNNTGASFRGGVWIDEGSLVQNGVVVKSNSNNLIQENHIFANNGSAVVLSNNGGSSCLSNKITRNSTYNNAGLAIDLNFAGTTGTPEVSVNEDGDIDEGPNNILNFPIIDSVKMLSSTEVAVYGKAPAGSVIEIFASDGDNNKHGGRTLNYGEGRIFIGSVTEGSPEDRRQGANPYNIDGNIATTENLFSVVLPYAVTPEYTAFTATATVANTTSEFGPITQMFEILPVRLQSLSASVIDESVKLRWQASFDDDFAYFEIERSTDGNIFVPIGKVFPKSISDFDNYEFIDTDPTGHQVYYRLKMVSGDSDIQVSPVLMIRYNSKRDELLTRTFFSNQLNLLFQSKRKEKVSVQLFNLAGNTVTTKDFQCEVGVNYFQLTNLSGLADGIYFLKLQTSTGRVTQKLIKRQ